MKKIIILIGIVFLFLNLTGCSVNEFDKKTLENADSPEVINSKKGSSEHTIPIEYELTEKGIIKPEFAKKIIEETSDQLIQAISNKDAAIMADFIHPVKGVRFTPYTYVSLEQDIVFDRKDTKNYFKDHDEYLWGHYDGSGDKIILTPSQYYEEFIYSEDFKNAEAIGYNEVLSRGNMLENQFEVYKNAIVVEYYFSGFNPDYAGIDWRSLRLVFEEYENNWKLVGVINNQWTI